jgi:hypothetical protein
MSLAESILWIPPIDPYNRSDRLARAAAGSDDVVKLIAERCMELESGGRMIDACMSAYRMGNIRVSHHNLQVFISIS